MRAARRPPPPLSLHSLLPFCCPSAAVLCLGSAREPANSIADLVKLETKVSQVAAKTMSATAVSSSSAAKNLPDSMIFSVAAVIAAPLAAQIQLRDALPERTILYIGAPDLDRAIADPREGSLAEALFFLRNGRCSGNAGAEAEVQSRQRRELPRPYAGDGWRQLLGAH